MYGDFDNRKSTSGYLFTIVGGVVSLQSKLQKCVALSTTKASKEMLCVKKFFLELDLSQEEYIVWCDSQSALDLSKNATYHVHTKHIYMRFHWLRDVVEKKLVKLQKIQTEKVLMI